MSNIDLMQKAFENVSGKTLDGSYTTLGSMLEAFNKLYESDQEVETKTTRAQRSTKTKFGE